MSELALPENEIIQDESERFRLGLLEFGMQMSPENAREFIYGFEQRLLEEPGDLISLKVTHQHPLGMYIRTIEMPAGSLLTSEEHKTEHPFCIHTGDISVWTARDGFQTLHAPYLGMTLPGTKRILLAHTDTVWSTFHVTDKTDLAEIRKDILGSVDDERKSIS